MEYSISSALLGQHRIHERPLPITGCSRLRQCGVHGFRAASCSAASSCRMVFGDGVDVGNNLGIKEILLQRGKFWINLLHKQIEDRKQRS